MSRRDFGCLGLILLGVVLIDGARELDKLAWNIAMGRDFGGVHYRSDQIESMRLGEEVAIRFLNEEKMTFNEVFAGLSLTKFDGSRIIV